MFTWNKKCENYNFYYEEMEVKKKFMMILVFFGSELFTGGIFLVLE